MLRGRVFPLFHLQHELCVALIREHVHDFEFNIPEPACARIAHLLESAGFFPDHKSPGRITLPFKQHFPQTFLRIVIALPSCQSFRRSLLNGYAQAGEVSLVLCQLRCCCCGACCRWPDCCGSCSRGIGLVSRCWRGCCCFGVGCGWPSWRSVGSGCGVGSSGIGLCRVVVGVSCVEPVAAPTALG